MRRTMVRTSSPLEAAVEGATLGDGSDQEERLAGAVLAVQCRTPLDALHGGFT
jgi:hypothetical protein